MIGFEVASAPPLTTAELALFQPFAIAFSLAARSGCVADPFGVDI